MLSVCSELDDRGGFRLVAKRCRDNDLDDLFLFFGCWRRPWLTASSMRRPGGCSILWNNTYIVGNALLGMAHQTLRPSSQPSVLEAALVLEACPGMPDLFESADPRSRDSALTQPRPRPGLHCNSK